MFENGKKYFDQTKYGQNGAGLWIVGVIIVIAAFFIGQIIASVFLIGALLSKNPDLLQNATDTAALNDALMGAIGESPLLYGIMLFSFIAPLLATLFVTKVIHKRFAKTVLTAAHKFRWGRALFAALVTLVFAAGLAAYGHYSGGSPLQFTFDPKVFLIFAIISLLFIPIQSAAEEIMVRGYFNQALEKLIPSRWIVFIITSGLFSLMHLANPESQSSADVSTIEHIMMMGSYFLFGFILCVVVYFEGGLEAVIGVHVANNLFAAVFVNYEGSVLPTPSLFLSPPPDGQGTLFAVGIYMGLIALILFFTRKKFLPDLQESNIVPT